MVPKASFRPSIKACFGRSASMKVGTSRFFGGVLGSAAVKAPMFDFTAGGRHPDVFSSFETFAMLSSTIEDVGVAAFKGQIGNLAGTSVLSAALQIHSVEARHASSVRLVVGKSGSEGAFDKPMSKNEVLEAVKRFFVRYPAGVAISVRYVDRTVATSVRLSAFETQRGFPVGGISESSWPQGAKMRQKSRSEKQPAEEAIKDIRWRRVNSVRPRRRLASCWRGFARGSIAQRANDHLSW